MIKTIYHISNCSCNLIKCSEQFFINWLKSQSKLQVDIETDVTDKWNDKTLISIQFGSCTSNREAFFIQWSETSPICKQAIKEVLENPLVLKIAHNARFEYIVLRFNDIIIENLYCTMLSEKTIRMGISENTEIALADLTEKYVCVELDKTEQLSFGDNIITESKIYYGIGDVAYLDAIYRNQLLIAHENNQLFTLALDNMSLSAFSDMTYEGMLLNTKAWLENLSAAEPIIAAAKKKMDTWLLHSDFYEKAKELQYISEKDRFLLKLSTRSDARDTLLKRIIPDLIGTTKPILNRYLVDNGKKISMELYTAIYDLINGNSDTMKDFLLVNYREALLESNFLVPAGVSTINWGSNPQVLELMLCVEPRLKGLSEEDISKTKHQALKDLQRFRELNKLKTTYGEEFINKYLNSDSTVRPNYNPVVSTGRSSCSNPNMQNIIVTEEVGLRYRNCFIAKPGYVLVDSDFSGQELCLIAHVSKDPVWLSALNSGQDLHSVCAELVYKYKWREAAESDCKYYNDNKQKCKCKKHKLLRDNIKSINFGLAYGMTAVALSSRLGIQLRDAMKLIEDYFREFPNLKRTLEFLGNFGIHNGYTMTLNPFFRRRHFPYWKNYTSWIEMHISGVKNVPALGDVERASKNHPIQGSGADMMKVAQVLCRDFIKDNNLRDKIKLNLQVHDQLTTSCTDDIKEWWSEKLTCLMEEAGKLIVPSGIVKAETTISPVWTK